MAKSHATLKLFRQIHLWFGVFISPMLLFFAFTGALQTFNLHEATPGSSYKPPAWIMYWAQIHKKQTWVIPPRRLQPSANASVAPAPNAANPTPAGPTTAKSDHVAPAPGPAQPVSLGQPPQKSHLPMKIFFLIISIGLFTSTLTGIYMAYKFQRNAWLVSGLLSAGVIIPIFLLSF